MELFKKSCPKDLLFEKTSEKFSKKMDKKYLSLKTGILELVDNTLNKSDDDDKIIKLIEDYINNPNDGLLNDFVEDLEIFNFYLNEIKM